MKILTLTQPYSTLIALLAKKIETRSWSTAYRIVTGGGALALTVAQVAERKGCAARTVRLACQSGALRAQKLGRDWLITPDAADAWEPRPEGWQKGRVRQTRSRPMIAVEITLTTGTFFIPLPSWNDGRSVRLVMDGGERVLRPQDVRVNWDAWVSDLVDESQMLTREELDAQHPGIKIA